MPMVSVIIPTYNRSALLKQATASVLAQTFGDFEMIVVDDGSTDDTCAVVENIQDPRLRYVYKANAGLAAARNTGIRHSQGEYIGFLDDDDLWLPGKLASQMQAFDQQSKIGLVTGGWKVIDQNSVVLKEFRPWIWRPKLDLETWLMGCPTVPSAVIVRQEWLGDDGGFDENLPQSEDWDRWLRLAYTGCPMAWVKELVCAYRIHTNSMVKNARKQKQTMIRVLDKFFADPALPDSLRSSQMQVYAAAYLRGAAREYGVSQCKDAAQDLSKAIGLQPNLLQNNGERIYQSLISWAGDPMVGDPQGYIKNIFDNIPEAAIGLEKFHQKAVSTVAKQDLTNDCSSRDWTRMRQDISTIALNDPLQLVDRGVIYASLKLVFGPDIVQRLKKIFSS